MLVLLPSTKDNAKLRWGTYIDRHPCLAEIKHCPMIELHDAFNRSRPQQYTPNGHRRSEPHPPTLASVLPARLPVSYTC